ncbi:hypothetical protein [Streptomyces sp. NPDC003635]
MGRTSAGLVGIVTAAALTLGLVSTIETGHPQGHQAGARILADDGGPTVIGKLAAGSDSTDDDGGPTVIGKGGSGSATTNDDGGPTGLGL